jgi:hypothetical protein
MDQLKSAKDAVMTFMTASDDYQTCVLTEVAAKKKAATAAKTTVDPAVLKAADDDVASNQADKEKVGAEFNDSVHAYKAAHPG